jgi:hypothetical protein
MAACPGELAVRHSNTFMPVFRAAVLGALLAAGVTAFAHHVGKVEPPRRTALPSDPAAMVKGYVTSIVVEDRISGTEQRYGVLVADDGTRYLLQGALAATLRDGAAYAVDGRTSGAQLFVDDARMTDAAEARGAADAAKASVTVDGVLRLGHADNFDGTPSNFFYAVTNDTEQRWVTFGTLLDGFENGMSARVTGHALDDGAFFADRIIVLEPAPSKAPPAITGAVTTSYIVIPVKFPTNAAAPFTYNADPFTVASLRSAMFDPAPTKSVAEYYKEVSYGQQLVSGIVADNGSGGWLLANRAVPATCDIGVIASAAEAAATARGYNLNSYAGRVYVFSNNVPGCGWSGLAYVGWARSYIKQSTSLLVISHEIGHNFGLLHAASLDCGANVIGGTCSSSEYGDPFNSMGNQRAMHFAAAQKDMLGWLPAGTVADHKSGTATYTLSPIENAGGAKYAVRIAAAPKRTYWVEYRQPIGMDAGLSAFPNNGVQVRVEAPFESICGGCSDDTEFLDMTPATSAFTDGALVTGNVFVDSTYGITLSAISQGASGLTVTVASPTRPSFVDVPATHPNYADIETIYWHRVTLGCLASPLTFCAAGTVSRAEMAVFIERAKRGAAFTGTATGTKFADVPAGHWAGGFIEQLFADGITAGCATSPDRFCPDNRVTRAEMAIFLLRARYGSAYNPGSATGTVFSDVPKGYWAAAWIERAYQLNMITSCGTGPLRFCPDTLVTRAEMATLLKKSFSLAPPAL